MNMNFALRLLMPLAAIVLTSLAPAATAAETATPAPGPVIASGTVPDEAARAAILGRLRAIYGNDRIVDQLEVGGVLPPPGWTGRVTAALGDNLRQIRDGRLEIDGTRVALSGTVANEVQRQGLVSEIARALSPAYTVNSSLRIGKSAQSTLDDALANRIIEFRSGSATLTPQGIALVDQLARVVRDLGSERIQIIGHTDSSGERLANVALSLARAGTVRDYLVNKGIAAERLSALGAGPDRPIADNASEDGRARNRRIEFRIVR